jgi:hypothetical protein
MIMLLFIVSTY